MPDYTKNYNLIKPKKSENYDIEDVTNTNMDIIDTQLGNKVEKVVGKGLSTCDFTNEYKKKLDGLSNYNDEKIKQDISDIQKEQEKQNDNIESIQKVDEKQDELIQKLKDNSINITTEQATQLHIEDASELPAVLEVRGNHYQKVTETAENVFNGKLELGEWNYNTGEKTDVENRIRSADYIDITGQTQISTVKKNGGTFGLAIRFYDADKNYIGRVSSPEVVDGVTNNVNNDLDNTKTVKYATLTILDTSDTTLEFCVNKGADLTWHDFIPNSPSLDYPSDIQVLENSVEIKKINANLLNNKQVFKDIGRSVNGLTISQNEDGSITINGTATAKTQFEIYPDTFKVIKNFKFDKFVKSGTISSEQKLTCSLFNEKWANIALNNYNNNLVISTDIVSIIQFQIYADAVFDNYIINYAISKVSLDNFVENEESSYTLPIQQPMMKGDYFDLERGKEVHHFEEYISTSEDNWILTIDSANRFRFDNSNISNTSLNNKNQYCSHSKLCYDWATQYESFQARRGSFYFRTKRFSTAEEFNQFVAEQEEAGTPLTFWYKCEPYELDLTKEQKEVLHQLQELGLFKGTNNIITAESLALLQMIYIADTKNYIDKEIENKVNEKLANINTQILELAGGK